MDSCFSSSSVIANSFSKGFCGTQCLAREFGMNMHDM